MSTVERQWRREPTNARLFVHILTLTTLLAPFCLGQQQENNRTTTTTNNNTTWLHLRFANSTSKLIRLSTQQQDTRNLGGGYAIEVSPPPVNMLFQYQPVRSRQNETEATRRPPASPMRSVRTAGAINFDDTNQEEQNVIVTNTCERDFMLVEIKTSRPFFGLIHTLDQRRKLICTTAGDGETHYKLTLSHALNPNDPQHCGVARLIRPGHIQGEKIDKESYNNRDLLSVVLAIRSSKTNELADDKFFSLNCTNRCRRPDCSSGQLAIGRLVGELQAKNSNGWRQLERESANDETDLLLQTGQLGRPNILRNSGKMQQQAGDENCSQWRPPWLLALLVCLSIILVGMLISNCLICLSLRHTKRAASNEANSWPSTSDKSNELQTSNRQAIDSARRKSNRKQINYDNNQFDLEPMYNYANQQQHEHSRRSHLNQTRSADRAAIKTYR